MRNTFSIMKVTFEMSMSAAIQAALNAGAANDEEASLDAMGIQRRSKFKKVLKKGNQYQELINQQRAGYRVIKIEVGASTREK